MSGSDEIDGRLLVIFDGHCVLCNGMVRWLLRRDRRDRLRFAAFDAENVADLLARHGIQLSGPQVSPSTMLVVKDFNRATEEILVRSDAALAMLRELPRPWPAIAAALRLIPRPVRDLGYRLVARLRNRIWGRLKSCPRPTAEERTRFL